MSEEILQRMLKKILVLMLMSGRQFFAGIAMGLEFIIDDRIETAGTDGKCIRFNPHFIATLSKAQLIFLVCHEVMHVALLHSFRRGGRDHDGFNIACDHQINLPLIDEDGFDMPEGGLADPRFSGMSAERIYSIQQSEQPEQPDDGDPCDDGNPDGPSGGPSAGDTGDDQGDDQGDDSGDSGDDDGEGEGQGNGQPRTYGPDDVPTFAEAVASGKLGQVLDAPGDAEQQRQHKAEVNRNIAIAVTTAKECGQLSGDLLRQINGRNESIVDWSAQLDDQLAQVGNDVEQTWAVKHRMFDDYLPGYIRKGFDHMVIGVDTSGSMNDSELKTAVSESMAIAEKYCSRVTFIPCDREIDPASVAEYEAGNFPESADDIALTGGGGTNPAPVFDWVEEQGEMPDALIFFTDGYINKWPEEVDYPVIWAMTSPLGSDNTPPTGRIVEIV